MRKTGIFIVAITVLAIASGCALSQAPQENDVAVAKAWLTKLSRKDTALSEVVAYMSREFNFDGTVTSDTNSFQNCVQQMRNVLVSSAIVFEFTNFTRLSKGEADNVMAASGHMTKYRLTKSRTQSMVLFELRGTLKSTGETNVDGVYLGFDSERTLISWFD